MERPSVSYKGFRSSSPQASRAAQGSSKKSNTRCELMLRKRLWREGCRYRANAPDLPGKPDIVFNRARVVIFCDGDFWHGRSWEERRAKLERGNNAEYWIAKIARNMERDRQRDAQLEAMGWTVIRVWESDIRRHLDRVVARILAILDARGHRKAAVSRPTGQRAAPGD